MTFKLAHLHHILAVANAGNFARAAEAEGVTQPALSHSIANFEREYGLRLFSRGAGGVSVTPAGSLVVEHARRIVAAADELDRRLRLFGKGETGRVAFGLGPHLASVLLPEVSGKLLRARPGLQIKPSVGSTELLLDELKDDQIEFIIGHAWEADMLPRIALEPLSTLTLAVLARGGHPLDGKKRVTRTDLASFPLASATDVPEGGPLGFGGCLVCDNFHILRDVVEQTDCIWVSSPSFVAKQLETGELVRLAVEDLMPSQIEIGIISRQDRTKSPAALALIDELRAVLTRLDGGQSVCA